MVSSLGVVRARLAAKLEIYYIMYSVSFPINLILTLSPYLNFPPNQTQRVSWFDGNKIEENRCALVIGVQQNFTLKLQLWLILGSNF